MEKFQLGTPFWSMISSLLHLVGLQPRVYYTLTNFRGGGGKAPLAPLNTYFKFKINIPEKYEN